MRPAPLASSRAASAALDGKDLAGFGAREVSEEKRHAIERPNTTRAERRPQWFVPRLNAGAGGRP
jgi:hypothetical protein